MSEIVLEERGVAMYKYEKEINEIVSYVKSHVKAYVDNADIKEGDSSRIIIPSSISDKIDFVEENNLNIEITVQFHDAAKGYGSGEITVYPNCYVNYNDKLNKANIEVECYANTFGYVYEQTLLNSLYHELNHCYDYFKQISNTKEKNGFKTKYATADVSRKLSFVARYITNKASDELRNKYDIESVAILVNSLLYELWSDTELNAFTTSVYGDLKGLHSERSNYKEDIKKCEAYQNYEGQNKYINILDEIEDDELFMLIRDAFINNAIKMPSNPSQFKKKFLQITKEKNDRFFKGIMRAASLYYDMEEDKNRIIKEYTKTSMYGGLIEGAIVEVKREYPFIKTFKRLTKDM